MVPKKVPCAGNATLVDHRLPDSLNQFTVPWPLKPGHPLQQHSWSSLIWLPGVESNSGILPLSLYPLPGAVLSMLAPDKCLLQPTLSAA